MPVSNTERSGPEGSDHALEWLIQAAQAAQAALSKERRRSSSLSAEREAGYAGFESVPSIKIADNLVDCSVVEQLCLDKGVEFGSGAHLSNHRTDSEPERAESASAFLRALTQTAVVIARGLLTTANGGTGAVADARMIPIVRFYRLHPTWK